MSLEYRRKSHKEQDLPSPIFSDCMVCLMLTVKLVIRYFDLTVWDVSVNVFQLFKDKFQYVSMQIKYSCSNKYQSYVKILITNKILKSWRNCTYCVY